MFNISVWIITTIIFFFIVLGLLAFLEKPNEKTNRTFLIMTLFIVVWLICNFLENEGISPILAKFLLRLDFASAVFVGYSWFLFVLNFSKAKKFNIKTSFKISFFSIAFSLSALSFTDLFISNIHFADGAIMFDMGYLWLIYVLGIAGFFITGYIMIILDLLKSHGSDKIRVLYVLLGFSVSSIIALVINLFLSNYLTVDQTRIGLYGMIIFILCTFYAIIKHHLFSIKIIATELFTLVIWIILLFRLFLSDNLQDLTINIGVFATVAVAGILLVRSVIKEVEQREKIEKIEKEVEKAYKIEKKANEELAELDKVKNQFLVQTQHDLRNPLSTIRGYCDLLISGTLGKQPKKTIDIVKRIEKVAEEKLKEVNNFLDVSQFRLGKGVVDLKHGIVMAPLIDEIVSELKLKARHNKIYLKFEKNSNFPPEDFSITADREKLKAAILNIVDNSIKYTKTGGVSIKLERFGAPFEPHPNEKARITISDTGIGIPADKIKTIFNDQFERSEEARKTAIGKGIGLYLAGQIIKYHNGKIYVKSEGENKGSAFIIELPVTQKINDVVEKLPDSKISAL